MNATHDPRQDAQDAARLLDALAGADGVFIVVSALGRITSAGGSAISLLTADGRSLVGRPLPAALRAAPGLEEALRDALDGNHGVTRCTVGETELEVRTAPLEDADGVVGAVAFAVAAPPAAPPAVPGPAPAGGPDAAADSGYAPLQGRENVHAALESAVRAAGRGHASALLHIRVDDLRLVNRALGRPAGEALLDDAAAALRVLFPFPVVISRVAAADFAVILEHLPGDPAAAAGEACERAVEALQGVVTLDEVEVPRTARGAIALIRHGDETPAELLQLAEDEALAQNAGRSAIAGSSVPSSDHAREDLRITARLPGAGERGELRLLYQPIYTFAGERVYGVEALLRWTDPDLGAVSPGRFIPIAEETGAIHALGAWVIEEMCRHATGWELEDREFQMHFNASASELQRPGYARDVLRLIARHRLAPSRFVLEVTESTAVLDPNRTFAVLAELRAAGMQIAIDDFGAGHSSLGRLKDLPADILKIDRGIIADVVISKESRAIVAAAVSLAGQLGMTTVAEGIETVEQHKILARAGCTHAQGFMLGGPSETVPRR
jgi:EAL domain-containing protein (putative c-di-GMP-specific phosphodiesterase class I)/GGDEF domain-containing protein